MKTWLELSSLHPTPLTTKEQAAFATEVRGLLDAAGAPGLDREHADAFNVAELFEGALLIVLPLISSPHASIQLQMTSTMILGTWDDKHLIWDNTGDGEEPLRVEGVDESARAVALAWLDHEIHRPFVRRDYGWGPLTQTTWGHTDGAKFSWSDNRGFLPVRTPRTQRREESSGYLDPVPAGCTDSG